MGVSQKESMATITSLDGTRTITVDEFDQLFDDASDEIDQFIDWSMGRMVNGGFEVRVGRHDETNEAGVHCHQIPKDAAE